MDPFQMVPPSQYKRENFFPCINEEYKRCIRAELCIRSQEETDQFDDDGPELLDDEEDPFELEKPKYDPDVYDGERIQKGDHLDVISLLSGGCQDGRLIRCVNNNPYEFDQVGLKDSLKNKKYVLIVCVFVPAKWCEGEVSKSLCQLSLLSLELLSSQPGSFEMIIVAKMRQDNSTGCEYDVDAFNQFFSAFRGRLAVPYSEAKIRDSVCVALSFAGKPKAILVGPDSTVLQDDVSFLIDYGAIGFPFTDDRLETLAEERGNLSLSGLLDRNPSFHLRKFNSHEEGESQSIEQLNKKLVGLYLFQRGDKLQAILDVYNQCRDIDRASGIEPQFEIVFVCMPLCASTDPYVFEEEVFTLLNSLKLDISSWWVFPYDNSVCLRLWQLCVQHADPVDVMIMVGPDNSFYDVCGAHVIKYFGISFYPFHRDVIVNRYVKTAKQVTLESLLPYEPCVERGSERVPLTELQGKNVIFYFYDTDDAYIEFTFSSLVDWYPKIKQVDPSFELVLVTSKDFDVDRAHIPKSWLVCVCDSEHFCYLKNDHEAFYTGMNGSEFRKGLKPQAVLAFGKDGYIHSLDAVRIRIMHGPNAFPFNSVYKDVRGEIVSQMKDDFEFMIGYERELVCSNSFSETLSF